MKALKLLASFKELYPNVQFEIIGSHLESVHEDCTYLNLNSPKPILREGTFLRMVNIKGGADAVSIKDIDSCHKLAAWHNARKIM